MLVKKSSSSSEKGTGLSREPWRLGERPPDSWRQESAAKKLRSGKKGESCRSEKASSGNGSGSRPPSRAARQAPRPSAPSTRAAKGRGPGRPEALARPQASDNRLLARPAIRRGGRAGFTGSSAGSPVFCGAQGRLAPRRAALGAASAVCASCAGSGTALSPAFR